MEGKEFSAKTVELAIEAGLKELGLTRETADIKVLEEPQGGFLGFGKKAKVLVERKQTEGERALSFTEKLLEKMGVSAVVELKEGEEESELIISTTESNIVIGKRGEALDAVQYLASMYANTDQETFRRIVVDCEEYRAKRIEILKNLADKLAKKADETGRRVQLDPMNPYERRIIHAQLQANELVTTESRGEDPNRYVVIYPKNRKFQEGRKPVGARPFNRDNRPNDRRGGGFNRDGRREDRRGATGNFNRDDRRGGGRDRNGGGAPRKREEFGFGTYLGNTRNMPPAGESKLKEEKKD